ncbi:hypothetical protein PCANC_23357 [Puccinia coronata f. sp. avenae]|uniref:BZIP domain-containing protein n=1 Tax=Puccinia coronata f. sp. avenae TaxID=200324 RepID=A0A2N5TXQ4_9BASI|nr:hypothetical protein PCANC_23357 [Puccinia coronata f. sp. avenae]
MEMEKTAAPIDHQQYYNHLQGLATIDPTQPSPEDLFNAAEYPLASLDYYHNPPQIEKDPFSLVNTLNPIHWSEVSLESINNFHQLNPELIHPSVLLVEPSLIDTVQQTPLTNLHQHNLDPLLSTSNSLTTNSIDCWIDFTGCDCSNTAGNSSSNSSNSSNTSPISPTALTDPSGSLPALIIDQQQSWFSPIQSTTTHPQKVESQAAFERQCTTSQSKPAHHTPPSSPSQSSSAPVCSSSPSPSSTSHPPIASKDDKKSQNNNSKKKKSSKSTAAPRRKKADARNEFLERNRIAASRSRAKKKSHQQFLEEQARRLEEEQVRLKQIILQLVAEKEHLKRLLDQRAPHPNLPPSV